jgi:hypothetical protein
MSGGSSAGVTDERAGAVLRTGRAAGIVAQATSAVDLEGNLFCRGGAGSRASARQHGPAKGVARFRVGSQVTRTGG